MNRGARRQLFPKAAPNQSKPTKSNVDTDDVSINADTVENKFQRKILLLNSIYHINGDKFVKVGLDLHNSFKCVVEIGKNVTKIPYLYLDLYEWQNLFMNDDVITDFFTSENPEKWPHLITDTFYISFSILYDQRCIRLTNRREEPAGSIYFTQPTWSAFKKFEPSITYTLESLNEKISTMELVYNNFYKELHSFYSESNNVTKDQIELKCKEFYISNYSLNGTFVNNSERACAAEIVCLGCDKIFEDLKSDETALLEFSNPNFYTQR